MRVGWRERGREAGVSCWRPFVSNHCMYSDRSAAVWDGGLPFALSVPTDVYFEFAMYPPNNFSKSSCLMRVVTGDLLAVKDH